MAGATTSGYMSTGLLKVAERARRDPDGRILALARLIDVAAFRRAYDRQRKDAAAGVGLLFFIGCSYVLADVAGALFAVV